METKNSKTLELVSGVQTALEKLHNRIAELEEENAHFKARLLEENTGHQEAFDCIAVTNVQVFPFKEGANLGHIKGLATIVLNDQIQIRGLRVMDGENGLYVGYPNDPFYKGEDFRSIVLPITKQLKEHIENCVLEKYQAAIA